MTVPEGLDTALVLYRYSPRGILFHLVSSYLSFPYCETVLHLWCSGAFMYKNLEPTLTQLLFDPSSWKPWEFSIATENVGRISEGPLAEGRKKKGGTGEKSN